jgi:outer membrane receptor for monomeric catechols
MSFWTKTCEMGMHIGLLRIIAATTLLVCIALAADAGTYRTAPTPGRTNATHRSVSSLYARRVPSEQRLAPAAWRSPNGRRGVAFDRDSYAHPKAPYNANRLSSSRAAQPIQPVGATVITRQMLDDLNATTIRDALRYVPGVTVR